MKKRISAAFLIAIFSFASSNLADAATNGLSKEAINAASLSDLEATDDDLDSAISTLTKEVAKQQRLMEEAKQAAEAANEAIEANKVALDATLARIAELQKAATKRAVDEYIQPRDEVMSHILSSDGIEDASRRSQLLVEFNGRQYATIEDLKAARTDLEKLKQEIEEQQRLAQERRDAEQTKLDALNAALSEKANLEKMVQARIDRFRQEAAASAASERIGGSSERASRGEGGSGGFRLDRWPSPSHKINSPFGSRWGSLHPGIDIEAKTGTPLSAAKAGRVTYASWMSGYGNYTCIDHGGGFSTCYAHQSRIVVSVGQQVQSGQLIGYSGNTGFSTGPHLHFETRINGKVQNPMNYLP